MCVLDFLWLAAVGLLDFLNFPTPSLYPHLNGQFLFAFHRNRTILSVLIINNLKFYTLFDPSGVGVKVLSIFYKRETPLESLGSISSVSQHDGTPEESHVDSFCRPISATPEESNINVVAYQIRLTKAKF